MTARPGLKLLFAFILVSLAAYTATPLFLFGVMLVYPQLWLILILGLPALAYSVYLLYSGVPVMMGISRERGFLFASAVMAVGLVMLVGVLAATGRHNGSHPAHISADSPRRTESTTEAAVAAGHDLSGWQTQSRGSHNN